MIGAVLVFLVLPNPLSVPQNNPTASAEYAPVPGEQQQAENANFAETQAATSAGVGAGGEGIGALPGVPPPPLPEFKPRQKNCVGNPPRQTEDPLSPPCVPFFEGDNGGATAPGVTKDDIKIVLYTDRCCEGDMNEPYKPSDEGQCDSTYEFECTNIVRTVKAHLRYFQRRYQTYGRTVDVVAQKSSGNVGGSCASRQADAKNGLREHEPFAVIHIVAGGGLSCYASEMGSKNVPSFGEGWPLPREDFRDIRPYMWGFFPDLTTIAEWSASFICRKLDEGTAKYAGDPTYHDQDRKFGFIRPEGDSRGPELRLSAALLESELQRQCGFEFDEQGRFDATGTPAGGREAPQIISRFKQEGVTTVVCYCIPILTESTAPTMQRTAESLDYFPEWYWDSASRYDESFWWRAFGVPEHRNFGSTFLWRNPALREQYHFQAYREEEPGSDPNWRSNFEIYHVFLNLFQAIQAAGPNLTVDTVEQGMFTFNYLNRQNPFIPLGGYGPYGPDAISDYTFVDSAMGWWWDPTGTPPGGQQGEGCMRVIRQGLRVYPDEWPRTDEDLFHEDDPCTQDGRKLADPGGSSGF